MLPYPVVLAAAGVVVGLLPGGQLGHVGADVILLAFVPGLVFEAALTLDLPELRRRLLPVGLLATIGVALTVLLIGTLTHLVLGLSWASAMLLGAILAATDPIAVVTLMRQMKAPFGLSAILEGESLFNDGTEHAGSDQGHGDGDHRIFGVVRQAGGRRRQNKPERDQSAQREQAGG
jgi:CPA1 family monovalent cation:H+ antiporter